MSYIDVNYWYVKVLFVYIHVFNLNRWIVAMSKCLTGRKFTKLSSFHMECWVYMCVVNCLCVPYMLMLVICF